MTLFPAQDSMVRGEISPRLHARASLDLYRSALAICENYVTLPHGGIRKRSGTYFAGSTKDYGQERPIPFVFSEDQAYMLFFGDGYFRVYAYGGPVLDGPDVVEVVTPYAYDDVVDLQFEQSGDVLYVTHPDFFPRKITRASNTDWSIEAFEPDDGPFSDGNTDKDITMYASASTGTGITLTSVGGDAFTDALVGQLVKLQVETFEAWPPWEAGTFLSTSTAVDVVRRYNGNVYKATEPEVTSGHKIYTGGTPPTHTEGEEWDGGSEDEEIVDGTASHNITYGVKWLYLHSGYGIGQITAVNSGTEAIVTALTDFPAELVSSGNASYRWSIGSFGGTAGFPRAVTISDERLFLGKKFSVFGSKTFDFTSFRSGADDDSALSFQLAGTSDITWLAESDGFVIVGTIAGVRTLSGAGNDQTLTPSSFKNRGSPTKRCSSIPPVKAGSTFIYVGFDRKSVVEMTFSLERNGYSTAPVSIISEHIPKRGISSICYQSETDQIFWMGLDSGELGGLTYEADQNVRGWHRQKVGGTFQGSGYGIIEWAASSPGQSGADDIWLVVKRTVNGSTVRHIEVLQPPFEYGDVEDAFFVDSGLTYEGTATTTVGGLSHLQGETVVALADSKIYRDLTVSPAGVVTLPQAASKIHVGLPYTAVAETLETDAGGRDGSVMGRRKRVNSVIFSVLESANVYVRSASRSGFELQQAGRNTRAAASSTVSLYTGNLDEVKIDDTWEGQGRIRIEAPDPVPCTIRAIIPGFDSEGS